MIKIPSKIPVNGRLPIFNGDFLVQRYFAGKIFHEDLISSFMWSC